MHVLMQLPRYLTFSSSFTNLPAFLLLYHHHHNHYSRRYYTPPSPLSTSYVVTLNSIRSQQQEHDQNKYGSGVMHSSFDISSITDDNNDDNNNSYESVMKISWLSNLTTCNIDTNDTTSNPTNSNNKTTTHDSNNVNFSLLSWNILSPTPPQTTNKPYAYRNSQIEKLLNPIPPWHKQRLPHIIIIIKDTNADNVFLQETTEPYLTSEIVPAFEEMGYDCEIQKGRKEGYMTLVTFWKRDKFLKVEEGLSKYKVRSRTMTVTLKDLRNTVPMKDLFDDTDDCSVTNAGSSTFDVNVTANANTKDSATTHPCITIINCHLEGHPLKSKERVSQLSNALHDAASNQQHDGLVLCGDFNCLLHSSACTYYLNNKNWGSFGGSISGSGKRSSKSSTNGGETVKGIDKSKDKDKCKKVEVEVIKDVSSSLPIIYEFDQPILPDVLAAVNSVVSSSHHPYDDLSSAYPPHLGRQYQEQEQEQQQQQQQQHHQQHCYFTYCRIPERPADGFLDQIWFTNKYLHVLALRALFDEDVMAEGTEVEGNERKIVDSNSGNRKTIVGLNRIDAIQMGLPND